MSDDLLFLLVLLPSGSVGDPRASFSFSFVSLEAASRRPGYLDIRPPRSTLLDSLLFGIASCRSSLLILISNFFDSGFEVSAFDNSDSSGSTGALVTSSTFSFSATAAVAAAVAIFTFASLPFPAAFPATVESDSTAGVVS